MISKHGGHQCQQAWWPSVISKHGGNFFIIIVNVATLRLKGLATNQTLVVIFFTTKGAVTPPDKGAI